MIDEVESAQTHRSQALVRRMKTVFEQYIQNYKSVPPDIIMNVIKLKESGELADYIAGNTALDAELKQDVLEIIDADQRLEFLIDILQDEIKNSGDRKYHQFQSQRANGTKINVSTI